LVGGMEECWIAERKIVRLLVVSFSMFSMLVPGSQVNPLQRETNRPLVTT